MALLELFQYPPLPSKSSKLKTTSRLRRTLGGIKSQRKLDVITSDLYVSSILLAPQELFLTVCTVYSISMHVLGHLHICKAHTGHLKSRRHSKPGGLQDGPSN